MTDLCAGHRPHLGALADGEVDLVPAATRHHAVECPECAAEVEAHRMVTRRLRAGLTADATTIALWCSRLSDRRPPPVSLVGLELDGARMDAHDTDSVVTVFYRTSDGGHVSIGWISTETSTPARGAIETRQASRATVLVVHAPAGSAVLSGDVPLAQLWQVAGLVEATSG